MSVNSGLKATKIIGITSRPPSRKTTWNQLSQFWRTSTKVIPIICETCTDLYSRSNMASEKGLLQEKFKGD